jgi:hypothetical protein
VYASIVNRCKKPLKPKCLDLHLHLLKKVINSNSYTKFDVLTAMSMKIAVSWYVKRAVGKQETVFCHKN